MSLAEGVSARVAYKFYSDGIIDSNTEADTTTDPGDTDGQILRRVASTPVLTRDPYQSNEILASRQVEDFRLGTKRVNGGLNGEYSPLTYKDFFEAAFRGTWAAAISKSEAQFTDVASSSVTSKFTFGGGNPVTEGFKIGMVIRFTNLVESTNNNRNFVILAFSAANNREVTVYPAPTTAVADVAFTVASIGKKLIIPSSAHVSRKVAIEHFYQDIDFTKLFTESRVTGFNMQLPASGIATIDFNVMGRNLVTSPTISSPYLTDPADETTTGLIQAVNGVLLVSGEIIGVVTGLTIGMVMAASGDAVVGQDFVPEIYLGKHNVTGNISADLEDGVLLDNFRNEDEISVLAYFTTSNASAAEANTIYLPRIKFTAANDPVQGEGSQKIALPFQALRYKGAAPGVEATTIQLCDTEVV